MKKFLLAVLLFGFTNSYSQYTQQWIERYNGSDNSYDIANNLFLDEQSNVFVYGTVFNENTLTDISAFKYSSNGSLIWKYEYPSAEINNLQDVYKDASNFSYLTGYIVDSGRIKLITIKLDPAGNSVWGKVTAIPNHETHISHSITVDNLNNVYVLLDARIAETSRTDFIIVKYNSAGTIVAQETFEGSTDGDDNGIKIICDAQGSIFAGVNSFFTSSAADIVIYKLDTNLNEIYNKRINGAGNSDDGIVDIKLAYDNNIIFTAKVSGAGSSSDIGTYKIDNSTGDILWQKLYNGIGNDIDLPYAMTTDSNNNILVTGYARNSHLIQSEDVITLKYDANGNLLWSRVYNDSVNGSDQGFSICTDASGNVYIGGAGDHGSDHLAYLTLKYDSDGNFIWKGSYHFYHLSEDFIYKIAVNNAQDIFISGISFSNTSDYDITTIKYARQTGIYSNNETVTDFKLYSNYPNPFNPSTKIRFYNPERNFITIKVFDLNGREVALLENKILISGNYEYEFKPENLSSGVYLYKVFYGENFKTGRMIFSK
ncbi:MAG: T9SS type A sorting domain-containing protein [Ignavibacteria bacterium]|nr:T9SS type A sorting domain-containing protein [Ignavibacteria bacterium]